MSLVVKRPPRKPNNSHPGSSSRMLQLALVILPSDMWPQLSLSWPVNAGLMPSIQESGDRQMAVLCRPTIALPEYVRHAPR